MPCVDARSDKQRDPKTPKSDTLVRSGPIVLARGREAADVIYHLRYDAGSYRDRAILSETDKDVRLNVRLRHYKVL